LYKLNKSEVHRGPLSWLRGAGGIEISNQISALAGIWTQKISISSPADYRSLNTLFFSNVF